MNAFQKMRARDEAHAEAEAARRADPAFDDVQFLRTRGFVVTGAGNAWRVDGKAMTRAALHDKADAVRARMARVRVVTTPPPPSPKPVVSAMEARMEGRMPNDVPREEFADKQKGLRGKTEHEVKDDLEACRDAAGGWGALAALTGAGKSTLANAFAGHARIGESVMAALYGAEGGDLRPELQELWAARDAVAAACVAAADVVMDAEAAEAPDFGTQLVEVALDAPAIEPPPDLSEHPMAQPVAPDLQGDRMFVTTLTAMAAVVRGELDAAEAGRRAALLEAERQQAEILEAEVRLNALTAAIAAFGGEISDEEGDDGRQA